jgi:hypothetical protein
VSQVPFILMTTGTVHGEPMFLKLNVIFTMFFSLLILWLMDAKIPVFVKFILIVVCLVCANQCDYGIFGVALVVAFHFSHNNKKQLLWFASMIILTRFAYNYRGLISFSTIETLKQNVANYGGVAQVVRDLLVVFGSFLPLGLILRTDEGRQFPKVLAKSDVLKRASRWLFYIFYPAHMLVIALLEIFVLGK